MSKKYFYLLKSKDKNGKDVYAQQLQPSSFSVEPTLTCIPEYATRSTSYQGAKELQERLKQCGNFVSKFDFTVVKYLMEEEQLSWSPPKDYEFKPYEDLLEGRGCEDEE